MVRTENDVIGAHDEMLPFHMAKPHPWHNRRTIARALGKDPIARVKIQDPNALAFMHQIGTFTEWIIADQVEKREG